MFEISLFSISNKYYTFEYESFKIFLLHISRFGALLGLEIYLGFIYVHLFFKEFEIMRQWYRLEMEEAKRQAKEF